MAPPLFNLSVKWKHLIPGDVLIVMVSRRTHHLTRASATETSLLRAPQPPAARSCSFSLTALSIISCCCSSCRRCNLNHSFQTLNHKPSRIGSEAAAGRQRDPFAQFSGSLAGRSSRVGHQERCRDLQTGTPLTSHLSQGRRD